MERLSSFDASFLANERGGAHMAIGALLLFDGEAPGEEELRAQVESRLHRAPRLRRRLAFPSLALGTPVWVEDPEFDLDAHLGRRRLEAPGSAPQLRRLLGELLAPPLPRTRPLWQLVLIDGFEEERFAILYRTHHAMADGISAVDIGMLLFDADPDPDPEPAAARPPRPAPDGRALLAAALGGLLAALPRAVRRLGVALRAPRRAGRRAADGIAGLWEVARNLAAPAPRVAFNRPVGARRDLVFCDFDLAQFKAAKNALGGTVNDVALAVTAGAIAGWLAERGA